MFFVHALHQKYGDMVRVAPNMINCNDPAMFRQIHRHSNGFEKSQWYQRFANTTDVDENHALFNMSSPRTHATRRKLMARAFSKTEIRKNWEDEIRYRIDLALDKMGKAARMHPTGEVDCQKWWMMMVADVSSKITFGESFDMLEEGVPDVPQENKYFDAISHMAEANTILAEVANLDFVVKLGIPFIQRLFKITETVLELAALTVAKSKSGTAGASNIFTGIIAEAEKSNSRLSDLVLSREARSLIIAGTDTTAIPMSFILFRVLSQPQLRDDLVAELTQQKERKDRFSDEELEKLPLLNATIQETLRLHGPLPSSLPRVPPPGGATVGGVYVPDSAVVTTQAWSLHRHPRIWQNPDEYAVQISSDGASELTFFV